MNINHTKMTLEINSCKNYEILEVRQGDKGSRIIDFAFTVNGETVELTSTMSAKVNATVDDVIVADSVAAVVDTENNVVTVTLTDAMLALSGVCKMDIMLTEGDEIITAESVCLRVGKSVINDDSKAFPGASSIVEITKEVENARGGQNSLGARLDTVDANLTKKADKTSTLAGYGITDAYTKEKTDQKLAQKLNSMPFDSEPKYNSPCYLTSGTVYNALQTKTDENSVYSKTETDDLLGGKADKVEVDTLLANKANLINSSNIFDFDKWADYLSGTASPRLTIDSIDKVNKSISITTYDSDGYTNHGLKFTVKPNTTYTLSWVQIGDYGFTFVYLNGVITSTLYAVSNKGVLTFETKEDTSYITLRFGIRETGSATISKIMLEEGDKKSLYLPYEVAEGVTEVANEVLAFEKTTQASLDGKYDSSNIESGTSMLTPYSTVTDKIKSANCTYKTIGDIVIVSATVKMNAATIGANSTYPLIDLPYKCIAEDNVFCVGISNLGKVFKFAVLKNNTWLQFQTQDKTAYTFADGEQINVICSYKIK